MIIVFRHDTSRYVSHYSAYCKIIMRKEKMESRYYKVWKVIIIIVKLLLYKSA